MGKFHYIGHSYGAILGTRLAADHPSRVKSLVLVSGGIGKRQEFQDKIKPQINKNFNCMIGIFYGCCCACCVTHPDPRAVKLLALGIEEVGLSLEDIEKLKAIAMPVQGIIGTKDTVS